MGSKLGSLLAVGVAGAILVGCTPTSSPTQTPARSVIAFGSDSDALTPDLQQELSSAAARWLAGDDVELVLEGPFGEARLLAERRAVSIRRANAVQDALIARGVPHEEIAIIDGCTFYGALVENVRPVMPPDRRRPFRIVFDPPLFERCTVM